MGEHGAPPAEEPMIKVGHLRKSFGGKVVLEDVNFAVPRGTVCAVMGGSGSGKSTILRHLIGAYKPDSGEIYLDGEEITHLSEREMDHVRRKFGMLFQGGALLNSLTVGENVALPIRHHTDLPEETIKIMVKMKLELVGLRDAEHLRPSQISGGMQKRVSLARAIALDPKIVFYDEPSAGLDPIVVGVIDKLMMDLSKAMGITSLVVTHEMQSVFRIADMIVMLHRGRIVAQGTPDEIRNSPDPLVQQFITGAPDGPIPLRMSEKDYAEDILGLESEGVGR
jgi:phospholipid/cholesterol/gamma-HCH transport system ATP-binding protein